MTDDALVRRDRIARAFAEYEAEHGSLGEIRHSVQVTSFGGTGSTAVSAHLAAAGVDLPRTPGEYPFKHQRVPAASEEVPPSFRVLYVFADPRNAMLSIFRRGFIEGHYLALQQRRPSPEVGKRLADLDSFLEGGVDDFALEDHVDRWMQPLGYSVMFVRYEALPNAWAEVRQFVGLPETVPCLEMQPRASDWTRLSAEQRERFDAIYGTLAARLDRLPDAYLVPSGPTDAPR